LELRRVPGVIGLRRYALGRACSPDGEGGHMAKLSDEIKKEVKKKVAEITELPEDKLTETATFVEDLGVDSMMALEIVASIEKKYKVTVAEEDIPKLRSLKEVYALLEKQMK
jgi:acyl carrier protein